MSEKKEIKIIESLLDQANDLGNKNPLEAFSLTQKAERGFNILIVKPYQLRYRILSYLQKFGFLTSNHIESYEAGIKAIEVLKDNMPDDVKALSVTYRILANTSEYYGDYSASLDFARLSRDYAYKTEDNQLIALSLISTALIYSLIGEHAIELSMYRKALEYYKTYKGSKLLAVIHNNIAYACKENDLIDEAKVHMSKALIIEENPEDSWYGLSDILNTAGDLELYQQQYKKAKTYFEKALTNSNEHTNYLAELESYYKLAIIDIHLGLDSSMVYLKRAFDLTDTHDLERHKVNIHMEVAQAYDFVKQYDEAYHHLKAGTELKKKALSRSVLWRSKVEKLVDQIDLVRKEAALHAANAKLLENELSYSMKQLIMTQEVTIQIMAVLTETRDADTGNHIYRTMLHVKKLMLIMKESETFKDQITDEMLAVLHKAAQLHDIGKVGIPDAILLKPGKLTYEEFEVMKKHTQYGENAFNTAEKALEYNSFVKFAREIAGGHHEKWDGNGYPKGLSGESIPLSARIMAITDVYDALISERPYKRAFSHEEAMAIIREGVGSHFDPRIGTLFIEHEEVFKSIGESYSDQSEPIYYIEK